METAIADATAEYEASELTPAEIRGPVRVGEDDRLLLPASLAARRSHILDELLPHAEGLTQLRERLAAQRHPLVTIRPLPPRGSDRWLRIRDLGNQLRTVGEMLNRLRGLDAELAKAAPAAVLERLDALNRTVAALRNVPASGLADTMGATIRKTLTAAERESQTIRDALRSASWAELSAVVE